jgi:hypothetical protein
MSTTSDTDYVYELYGIKRENFYIRSPDDINNEKKLVNSNRFLSATFLKKHTKPQRVEGIEKEIKIERKKYETQVNDSKLYDNEDERKFTYCYFCSIGAHFHEKTKPVPVSKRRYLKKYVDLSQWLKKIENDFNNDFDYVFKIKTGSNKYAGTNANVINLSIKIFFIRFHYLIKLGMVQYCRQ